ncbi:putative membrane protein [Wickerhamomyces ciferrii]|uniref:Membrane protein n=1 Tax=Wickerhamomyces ciferrii (strain ATCC 14091 / BCRC 22168 / CBS 111 / JCM 3599 / NBRC 0793 / NRRL Y-1031 F-60-10) TaxID=1206466 RepID=K0KXF7_WICCF|nr:uncharacterized protein BN7_6319 [Wickerhamomyces ciferrii]CCH46722.1 putative membrane protein [Wickerhamomyces ciferrii]
MSEQIETEKVHSSVHQPKSYQRILSNTIFGYIIRVSQFISTILVLALSGDSLNRYATSGSMGFTIFTAVFTLIYLIVFTVIMLVSPNILILGVNLLLELLITVFWFVSFIAIAAIYGPDECSATVGYGWYRYTYISNSCKSSKAAIAFAAVNFVLFLISFVSLAITSFKIIPAQKFWEINDRNGLKFNKPLLAVSSVGNSFGSNDIEKPIEEIENSEPHVINDQDEAASTRITNEEAENSRNTNTETATPRANQN